MPLNKSGVAPAESLIQQVTMSPELFQGFYSAHYHMETIDHEGSDIDFGTVEDVGSLLASIDDMVSRDDSVDPTPIGPSGIRVVSEVKLDRDFGWRSEASFIQLLSPLLSEGDTCEQSTKIALTEGDQLDGSFLTLRHESTDRRVEPSVATSTLNPLATDNNEDSENTRFKEYQSEQWCEKFQELVKYQQENGHCLVPHNWTNNKPLAQWVKRQRYQYKLKAEGRHSTLTPERQDALERLGFVWDSHGAAWEERLNELRSFHKVHGHSIVRGSDYENRQLAIWAKCQRRQFRLFTKGKRSYMTKERIAKLNELGFEWNPRQGAPIISSHSLP